MKHLSCLGTEPDAALQIDFGVRGCFGGSDNRLRLSTIGDGFAVEGFAFFDPDQRDRVGPLRITSDRAAAIVTEIARVLTAAEVPDRCLSTSKRFAHLTARCSGELRSMTLTSHGCFGDFGLGKASARERANDVSLLAREVLKALPGHSVSGLTSEELEQERRKWSTVYGADGMRLRHDPVEPWEDGGN